MNSKTQTSQDSVAQVSITRAMVVNDPYSLYTARVTRNGNCEWIACSRDLPALRTRLRACGYPSSSKLVPVTQA